MGKRPLFFCHGTHAHANTHRQCMNTQGSSVSHAGINKYPIERTAISLVYSPTQEKRNNLEPKNYATELSPACCYPDLTVFCELVVAAPAVGARKPPLLFTCMMLAFTKKSLLDPIKTCMCMWFSIGNKHRHHPPAVHMVKIDMNHDRIGLPKRRAWMESISMHGGEADGNSLPNSWDGCVCNGMRVFEYYSGISTVNGTSLLDVDVRVTRKHGVFISDQAKSQEASCTERVLQVLEEWFENCKCDMETEAHGRATSEGWEGFSIEFDCALKRKDSSAACIAAGEKENFTHMLNGLSSFVYRTQRQCAYPSRI